MTLTEYNKEEFIRNRKEEGKYEAMINMARRSLRRGISEDLIISDLQEELSLSCEGARELFEKEVACLA